MATSTVHVKFVDTYSTESFLMALRRFMCAKGTQSDSGDQLVAASKQIEKWDFKRVQPWAGKKEIELYVVPTRGQHISQWSG
jgi:hypothetical protein